MYVTEINLVANDRANGSVLATCSLVLEDIFVVWGIRLVQTPTGRILAMPAREKALPESDGSTKWLDVFHPITSEVRNQLGEHVFSTYNDMLSRGESRCSVRGHFEITPPDRIPTPKFKMQFFGNPASPNNYRKHRLNKTPKESDSLVAASVSDTLGESSGVAQTSMDVLEAAPQSLIASVSE